ncbi:MAG: hypothetical protein IPN94_04180 [Sphingobacteriales bacterium]|nr:hypothetical protein [Sphingobacteriales bacterium]
MASFRYFACHIAEDGSVLWDKIITFGTPNLEKEVIYTNDGGFLSRVISTTMLYRMATKA